jgi:hypothetical protein
MSVTWHADRELMGRYVQGGLGDPRAYSLEAHILACSDCRALLAGIVRLDTADHKRLDGMWAGVVDAVDAPRPGLVERALLRVGVRQHVARLLAATPSLRLSWLVAEALALAFAVLAAYAGRGQSPPSGRVSDLLFLAMTPLMPLAGVSVAYGPGIDPTYEIGLASPLRSFRLLLIRSMAVLATSSLIAAAASVALPGLDWTAGAWLLPSLGLTISSLALATFVPPPWAIGGVSFAWIATIVATAAGRGDDYVAFRGPAQLAFVCIIGLASLALVRRRETFDVWSEL